MKCESGRGVELNHFVPSGPACHVIGSRFLWLGSSSGGYLERGYSLRCGRGCERVTVDGQSEGRVSFVSLVCRNGVVIYI